MTKQNINKDNKSKANRAIPLKRTFLKRYGASVLIGLIGLTLSLAIFFKIGEWETERRKLDFDRLAEARCNSFMNQTTYYLHELTALKRLYDGSQFVSREEFFQFVTPILDIHKDIRGFGWAPRVTNTNRNTFEQVLQTEGWANFLIHDSSAFGEIELAAHHDEYYPILYRAPHLDWAIGMNQLSMSYRRKAIEQARDMNQLIVTRPTVFPGESKDRLGAAAFAPVYKKGLPISTVEERRTAIEGVVICAMRPYDIIENIIGKQQPRGTDIQVRDLSAPEGKQFLFQYRARLRDPGESDSTHNVENSSGLAFVTSFNLANRTWEMCCTPSSGYLASHRVWIHWVLLFGGLIITSLLAVFTYTRQNRMAIVEELVDVRTAQLRASEQQLKASNQQLSASEQQLRAGEQQLRASNQQLMASEQQLKASNQQLKQSQQKLALHVRNTPLGVIEWNVDFEVTDWNSAAEKMFGYTREEAIGRHGAGLILPESVREITDKVWSDLLTQKGGSRSINENITKDNKTILCDWYNTPLIDDNGNTIGVASLVLDITEAKLAEEALEESEKRFKDIAENMADWIWETDSKGVYTYVSSNVESILGYTADEVIGKTPFDFMTPKETERVGQLFQRISTEKKSLHNLENWNLTKGGQSVCLLTNGIPLLDDQGNLLGYRGVDTDITETIRLQALESRAERLETAGTIAGQVAHDFNNLLAPIMAYPDFIHELLPHDHKAHAYLDSIENAAQKIANINQDLLTMGRRGHYNLEVLDLNRVVLQAVQEMESRTKTVTCEMKLCEDLMKTKAGGAQIHRMLSNLLVNAQDAMQDIGQITIRTENYYADDTSVAFGRVPKGEYIKLTVSDNGCGIPEDIIQKILDPFFSTKTTDKKRGSGLGLSVVDAVMKDHDGYLDLSSKVGIGTSFYLYFPVTREDSGEADPERLMGGTETVLIVDDDNIQRDVSSQLLTKLGYNVSSVESGEKAIEFLGEKPQNLVILDMVMPGGIDGTETYRQILAISPHQKAIIISGFSESDRVFEVQKLGAGAFVKKPITKNIIAAAVRTELDRPVKSVSS